MRLFAADAEDRLAARSAQAAGPAADATYGEIVHARFAGRRATEVAADLADLLRQSGHQRIDITVVGGRIFLEGEVATENRRRAIAEVAREAAPGYEIVNEVDVTTLGSPEPELLS